jgi:hypothetical protein
MKKIIVASILLINSMAWAQITTTTITHHCAAQSGHELDVKITETRVAQAEVQLTQNQNVETFFGKAPSAAYNSYELTSSLTGKMAVLSFGYPEDHGNRCGRCTPSLPTYYFAKLKSDVQELNFTCYYN